jgi:hypothetical protein
MVDLTAVCEIVTFVNARKEGKTLRASAMA